MKYILPDSAEISANRTHEKVAILLAGIMIGFAVTLLASVVFSDNKVETVANTDTEIVATEPLDQSTVNPSPGETSNNTATIPSFITAEQQYRLSGLVHEVTSRTLVVQSPEDGELTEVNLPEGILITKENENCGPIPMGLCGSSQISLSSVVAGNKVRVTLQQSTTTTVASTVEILR